MVREPRIDFPGARWHLGNGGVGNRTIFEGKSDARLLLSLIAQACRRRWIEVHAFVVMGTHFHLLVTSLDGQISRTMQWIEQRYAVYFNRTRHRTDSVFGKRFFSTEVRTDAHWISVVRYIDLNPVRAGLAIDPESYAYGSARHYGSDRAPLWLTRSEVYAFLGKGAASYADLWTGFSPEHAIALVERRIKAAGPDFDPLDDLIRGADGEALAWVRRLARKADGVPPALSLLSPDAVLREFPSMRTSIDHLGLTLGKHSTSTIFIAGVLRSACGESIERISQRMGIPYSTMSRLLRRHRDLVVENDEYARLVAEFLHAQAAGAFPTRQSCQATRPREGEP